MASKILKSIALAAKASPHDVDTKVKNIMKWLKAGHPVKLELNGKPDKHKALEELLEKVENSTKSGAEFSQKQVKAGNIKVVLKPTSGAAKFTLNKSKDEDDLNIDTNISLEDLEKELDQSIKDEFSKTKKR